MTTFQITHKGEHLHVKKDDEAYSKTPHTNNLLTAASTFESLAARHDSTSFRWWHALRDYYKAGAPQTWEGTYNDPTE